MSKKKLIETLRKFNQQKEPRRIFRRGLLGRGVSGEESAVVEGRPNYMWVRNREDPRQVYQVLNAGGVPDVPNRPVIIGYNVLNPNVKEIKDTDWSTVTSVSGVTGTISSLPFHGRTHEYTQPDEINVHKRMLMPLRVVPDTPNSYSVYVQSDHAIYLGLNLLDLEYSDDYVYAPVEGIKHTFNSALGTKWYLLALTTDVSDNPTTIEYEGTSVTKPDISNAFSDGVMPVAYVYVDTGVGAVGPEDIEDIRPLYVWQRIGNWKSRANYFYTFDSPTSGTVSDVHVIPGALEDPDVDMFIESPLPYGVHVDIQSATSPTGTWNSNFSSHAGSPSIPSGSIVSITDVNRVEAGGKYYRLVVRNSVPGQTLNATLTGWVTISRFS